MISRPKVARERAYVGAGKAAAAAPVRQPMQMVMRVRFQLLGGIIVGVILPSLVRGSPASIFTASGPTSLQLAMLGSLVAMLLGYWALRQVIAYPGVQATKYIAPAFAAAFGLVIIAFFFLRIDYSRYQFGASFVITVVWFYGCFFLARRTLRQTYALVNAGDTKALSHLTSVDWVWLTKPEYPRRYIDGVVADLRADFDEDWTRFLADCAIQGLPVYHVKQMAEALTGKVEIEQLTENSFGSVLPSLLYLRLKRLVDLGLAMLAAPLALAAIAVAAVAIKLDSSGPVFFVQPRMGFRGRPFLMLKLRTMHVDGAQGMPSFTQDNDPRVTRVGRILRKYRIDEFPQIANIVAGQMSWIGPRPEALDLAATYHDRIPFYAYRHMVRPGISGWAQVNQGNVADVQAATFKLHYDFYYIKHFSPWLDTLIAAKTVHTILTGYGSR